MRRGDVGGDLLHEVVDSFFTHFGGLMKACFLRWFGEAY